MERNRPRDSPPSAQLTLASRRTPSNQSASAPPSALAPSESGAVLLIVPVDPALIRGARLSTTKESPLLVRVQVMVCTLPSVRLVVPRIWSTFFAESLITHRARALPLAWRISTLYSPPDVVVRPLRSRS